MEVVDYEKKESRKAADPEKSCRLSQGKHIKSGFG